MKGKQVQELDALMKHCHQVCFEADHGLSTFNGLSGSTIYKIGDRPLIVGIMIRATASSLIGHFIGADVLRHAILSSE